MFREERRRILPLGDKTVVEFEVPDLGKAISAIGQERLVQAETTWAVFHDPEGHNLLMLESRS